MTCVLLVVGGAGKIKYLKYFLFRIFIRKIDSPKRPTLLSAFGQMIIECLEDSASA